MNEKPMKNDVEFEDGRVKRRYTEGWLRAGIINLDELPRLMESVLVQRTEMVAYIESLQDKIDWILKRNHCCDIPECFRANCGSDHK